jgi:hypothetical protein
MVALVPEMTDTPSYSIRNYIYICREREREKERELRPMDNRKYKQCVI